MHGKDWEGAVAQASASDTGAEGGIGSEPGLVALATAGLLCYVYVMTYVWGDRIRVS